MSNHPSPLKYMGTQSHETMAMEAAMAERAARAVCVMRSAPTRTREQRWLKFIARPLMLPIPSSVNAAKPAPARHATKP